MKAITVGNDITLAMLPDDQFFNTSADKINTLYLVDDVIQQNIRAMIYTDFTDKYFTIDNGETN